MYSKLPITADYFEKCNDLIKKKIIEEEKLPLSPIDYFFWGYLCATNDDENASELLNSIIKLEKIIAYNQLSTKIKYKAMAVLFNNAQIKQKKNAVDEVLDLNTTTISQIRYPDIGETLAYYQLNPHTLEEIKKPSSQNYPKSWLLPSSLIEIQNIESRYVFGKNLKGELGQISSIENIDIENSRINRNFEYNQNQSILEEKVDILNDLLSPIKANNLITVNGFLREYTNKYRANTILTSSSDVN